MRFFLAIPLCVVAVASAAFAATTPEAAWKASLVQDNVDWAKKPHAILKIEDAAYLREGEVSSLVGTKGKPQSWHWVPGLVPGAAMVAGVRHAVPFATKAGKELAPADITKGIPIDAGVDVTGQATQVDAGIIGARFFVFNQTNKDAVDFKGVSYFDYDPAFVATAKFTPDAKRPPRVFRTSRGTDKQFYRVGDAQFTLKGKAFTLPFYADSNDPKLIQEISAFFTDDLTGKGAYGSGRYVDIDKFGPFPPKSVTIDFNYAYNPNCSRSAFYTCPVALDNLAIAVTAGERDPHAH